MTLTRWLFPPGLVLATPGVMLEIMRSGESFFKFLDRHVTGDWGEVSEERRCANTLALLTGDPITSLYRTRLGNILIVVTTLQQATTCLLMSDEAKPAVVMDM